VNSPKFPREFYEVGRVGAPRVTVRPFAASIPTRRAAGKTVQMRVLVAFGDEDRAYREVIAAGIRILRPRADVATATPAEVEGEIGRFDPQVVVCGRAGIADPGDVPAWVELPVELELPAKVRVGVRRRTPVDLDLKGLLAVVDEAEELVGKGEARASERGAP
jgi:hypothetical protein